jgi:hypothetical protein
MLQPQRPVPDCGDAQRKEAVPTEKYSRQPVGIRAGQESSAVSRFLSQDAGWPMNYQQLATAAGRRDSLYAS